MAISKLRIENFKGISKATEFEIRPITLFIGPNSSGKSSCIHALAALAQSSKLPSSGRPLVLDDEYAQVHLGRFIEVIHSKSYSDSIAIGIESNTQKRNISGIGNSKAIQKGEAFSADFSFKSTKRTQDIYLDKIKYTSPAGNLTLSYNTSKKNYTVVFNNKTLNNETINDSSLAVKLPPSTINGEDSLNAFFTNESYSQIVTYELANTLYLGPFRQSPLRRYPTRGSSPAEVGAQGENAITLLANEYVQTKGRPHLKQISTWLTTMGLAKSVEVSRVGKSDLFDVNVTLSDDATLPIADLGYGMSQVLPVLVQCSFAPKRSTLLFEQPELHLNHSAAKLLSRVFVSVTKEKEVHLIAETHSRELFQGLLQEIREGRLSHTDLAVYTVVRKDGSSQFKRIPIEIDEDGKPEVYDPWDSHL